MSASATSSNRGKIVEAVIDIRAIAQFLNGYQFASQHVLLSIAPEKAVMLFVLHDEMALTYCIPVKAG